MTAVPHEPLIWLTTWPTGQNRPDDVSTVNSFDGRVVSNAAIVPAGVNGSISVFVSNTTDVIIDINGYFAPPGTGGLAFYPVTPCRVADTRSWAGMTGAFGPPALPRGETRSYPMSSSSCGILSGVQAYSLNITVAPPGPLTYLTTWPTGMPMPTVSTLNSFDGSVVANAAVVPSGTLGSLMSGYPSVNIYASDATDVIIDLNGVFAPQGLADALYFYPTTPCRIVDTRGNGFTGAFGPPRMAGPSRTFPIQSSSCGLPSTAQAYSLNMTVVPPGPLAFLTAWPTGQSQPTVSTLNSFLGKVVANAAIVPAGTNGAVSVFTSNPTDLIIDVNGYFGP